MKKYNRLIKLSRKGRLLVFTDVHGNYDDYQKYIEKWDSDDPDCHIVIAGDFIHNTIGEDYSVEIVDDIMDKDKKYSNFHVLLGNHEFSHITDENIKKDDINLTANFKELIIEKKGSLEPYLSEYINYFKSLAFFLQTENGIFVSHAGPPDSIYSYEDFLNILANEDYEDYQVYSTFWNRPGHDYDELDVLDFLEIVDSKVMVVGHTIEKKGARKFGKQMILSSSFGATEKLYLKVDLSEDINKYKDLSKNLKKLNEHSGIEILNSHER